MSEPVLILGARRFAREVADLLADLPEFELAGFVENQDRERCATRIHDLPVFWVDELPAMAATHRAICAFGSTQRRDFIEQAAGLGMRFFSLIHPSARVSSRSTVGPGCIVGPAAQISSHVTVGAHVLVNRGVSIGHDGEVGDYTTIAPGANIAGACKIGTRTFIGMGAIVLADLTVGSGAVVAAGAVVTRDVADHVLVAGMPAVVVKRGVDGH